MKSINQSCCDDPDGSDADGDVPRNARRVQRMAAAVPIPRARYDGARHLPRALDIDHHMRCRMVFFCLFFLKIRVCQKKGKTFLIYYIKSQIIF